MKYLKHAFLLMLVMTWNFSIANPLKGIKEIGILVESLHDDAEKCNVSKNYIESSLRIALSSSTLKIVSTDIADSYIYVNTNIIYQTKFCVASIETSFEKYAVSERKIGTFWRKSGLLINGNNHNMQKRVGDTTDSHTKQFIGAWLKANQ